MLARLFYIFKVIKSETCTLVDNPHIFLQRVKHYVPRNPTVLCVIHNIFLISKTVGHQFRMSKSLIQL